MLRLSRVRHRGRRHDNADPAHSNSLVLHQLVFDPLTIRTDAAPTGAAERPPRPAGNQSRLETTTSRYSLGMTSVPSVAALKSSISLRMSTQMRAAVATTLVRRPRLRECALLREARSGQKPSLFRSQVCSIAARTLRQINSRKPSWIIIAHPSEDAGSAEGSGATESNWGFHHEQIV